MLIAADSPERLAGHPIRVVQIVHGRIKGEIWDMSIFARGERLAVRDHSRPLETCGHRPL